MEWLNYHHLLYFYVVAREGTIAKAGQVLRLAQPTISGQIRALEESFGEKLFVRTGRNLELTETGRIAYRYAEEIFTLGKELQDTLKGRPSGRPMRLLVGISDVVPKLIAHRLLEPALRSEPRVSVVVTEGKTDRLLADLSASALDLVIADSPITPGSRVRAFNHLLGESGLTFFARKDVAARLTGPFPKNLDGQPLLLPTDSTVMRRGLDRWLESHGVRPQVVAELADSALMSLFGERGEGVFPGPTAMEKELREHYGVEVVGRAPELRERFYAITVERRIKNPAVQAISDAARDQVFRE